MKHREKNREKRKFRIKHPLRYVVIALCIALFVLANMIIIFSFSAESQEESGDRSSRVTDFVLRIVYPRYDELPYRDRVNALQNAHTIIRKGAHFLEYALLGFLSASLMLFLRRYMYKHKIDPWKTWFYPAEFCFLYAVSDEVHQIFSERGSSAVDVLIDTAGALFGIVLIQLIVMTVRGIRNPKRGKGDGRRKKGSKQPREALSAEEEYPAADTGVTDRESAIEAAPAEEPAEHPADASHDHSDEGADIHPAEPSPDNAPHAADAEGDTPCALPPTD